MIWPICPSAAAKPDRAFPGGSDCRKCIAPASSRSYPNAAPRSDRAKLGNRCGVTVS